MIRHAVNRGSAAVLVSTKWISQGRLHELQARAAALSLGIAVGAPTFDTEGSKFISHILIDEFGSNAATVSKRGLTDPEATFFARGSCRSTGVLAGLRCSAVICREVEDFEIIGSELPQGTADLVFVPGALRQDPEKPRTDPPEFVRNIQRIAKLTGAYVVQTNWPNALNRPEESIEGGGSTVASPEGEVLFRLPMQKPGVGVFDLGDRHYEWHDEA